jgi:putative lipoprotein
MGALVVMLGSAACQGDAEPSSSKTEVTSGRSPNASVSGTVTYRERIALTPGATLEVSLRDVSLQDVASTLIARQTISDPGQVPIKFKVEYNRDDIDSRNTYGVQARIVESDGRLAFINDTAYDVITRGNPTKVDMVLVLVQPPPDQVEEGSDWRTWVETPVRVAWANLMPDEPEPFLRIAFYRSTMEGCSRPGSQGLQVDGSDVVATVTLRQPPPTPWAIPCDEDVVEQDVVEPIGEALKPGETYRVIVNDRVTTTFTSPVPELGYTVIAESPIDRAEIETLESAPPQYQLRVISRLPKGSSCSQFNGYEIRRRESNRIDVVITHHEVTDPQAACTRDLPVVETAVPLGSDFEQGVEYTVTVNSDTTTTFKP